MVPLEARPSFGRFGHRTNTLAFAKNDCHTCSSLNVPCDRRRPRCGVCVRGRRRCGGFALDLLWKDSLTPKKARLEANTSAHSEKSPPRPPRPQQLQFVPGRTGRRKRKRTGGTPYSATPGSSGLFSKFSLDPPLCKPSRDQQRSWARLKTPEPQSPSPSSGHRFDGAPEGWSSSGLDMPWATTIAESTPIEQGLVCPPALFPLEYFLGPEALASLTQTPSLPQAPAVSSLNVLGVSATYGSSSPDSPAGEDFNQDVEKVLSEVPAGVTFRNLAHKYEDILTMYDTSYCVVPLSSDCRSNPFRIHASFIENFPFLLHGVLAISSHHLARKNDSMALADRSHSHWSAALQLFSTALSSSSNFLPLLDTILILVSFEATQSAYGRMNMHLDGAHKMLQEVGALEIGRYSSRLRAQMAMLVWWDVTVSFLARRAPRLPSSYLETVMSYGSDETDGWSSFTLNGCPVEFVAAMHRLAKLASVYDQTTRMEYTIFDMRPVHEVVEEVKNYAGDVPYVENAAEPADDGDARLNCFHCVEAWRHAILLYTQRVFRPTQDPAGLQEISHHSRVVLDSARCIPPTETIQKQILLPVFLAASEAGDEWNRDFAREYCRNWNGRSQFSQFEDAAGLLEGVWSGWRVDTRGEYWWGALVPPGAVVREEEQPMARTLLLG